MDAEYKIEDRNGTTYTYCYGVWTVGTIGNIEKSLNKLTFSNKTIVLDLSGISELDSSGALLLFLLKDKLIKNSSEVNIKYKNERYKKLFELIEKSYNQENTIPIKKTSFIENIGKESIEAYKYILDFLSFFGELFIKFLYIIKKPSNFRFKETIYFINTAGINALPIIGMTSFLVGVVIAYQTIVQLSKFGADIFVVDASAISIARELGPMITAIVVAGRTASSYTAEIGAMKLTEEINAMKTMGFMPFYFLVIPRVVALIIALPLLIFFSDIVGIFGSMVATKAQIGLSFDIFINRVYEVLSLKNYLIGIVKGPFFAFIIAIIGVYHGLRVSQNTESIGKETTKSVVNAIFFVIVCDAIFSVIFTELGI